MDRRTTATLAPMAPHIPWATDPLAARGRTVCGICGLHYMLCECENAQHGKDFIITDWDIPSLPSEASPSARLARFLSLSSIHPSSTPSTPATPTFDWSSYLDDRLSSLLDTFPRIHPRVRELVKETNKKIYSDAQDRSILRCLRMKKRMEGAGPEEMREEAVKACEKLMTFDWTHLTKMDCTWMNNAFQRSDPVSFPTSDPDLQFVYETNEALFQWFRLWTSERGWHLSLEDNP